MWKRIEINENKTKKRGKTKERKKREERKYLFPSAGNIRAKTTGVSGSSSPHSSAQTTINILVFNNFLTSSSPSHSPLLSLLLIPSCSPSSHLHTERSPCVLTSSRIRETKGRSCSLRRAYMQNTIVVFTQQISFIFQKRY